MFTFVIVFCDVLCKSYIVALFTVVHISTFVAQNVSNKAFSNSNSNSVEDALAYQINSPENHRVSLDLAGVHYNKLYRKGAATWMKKRYLLLCPSPRNEFNAMI